VYVERGTAYRIGVKLAAEAIAVGRAQGYELGTVLGIKPDDWLGADRGDAAAVKAVQDGLTAWMATLLEPSQSSVGRDVARGRWCTRADACSGYQPSAAYRSRGPEARPCAHVIDYLKA
jgi:hypothetical protein